ncbi:MAG: diacylglycerol/lipid kinase family protein [Povalibacter sp.]|jgi:diacylglycerol kinase family enzyme
MVPASPTRDTPFFIVMNAASGSSGARERREGIESVLREAGQRFEILAIDDPKQLGSLAKKAAERAQNENGAVIVAGGDGTINTVAQAALPTGCLFGILPQGTFNYSGRAHGIPLDTEAATRALIDAHVKPVQVGLLNDHAFLVNASLGLYPQLLQDREAYKKQYGRNRVVAMYAGVTTLLRDHRQLTLEIEHDDRVELVRTPTLFVGNNPLQLEQVGLPEAEAVERRRLAAVIVKPISSAQLLWLAFRGALGNLGEAANVRDFEFKTLTVAPLLRNRPTIQVATDGEIWQARVPLKFSVARQSLFLMVPRT